MRAPNAGKASVARTASLTRSRRGPQAGIEKMHLIGGASPSAFWQNEPRRKQQRFQWADHATEPQALPTRSARPIRGELAERTQGKNSKDFSGP